MKAHASKNGKAISAALLVLLLSVVGLTNALAQIDPVLLQEMEQRTDDDKIKVVVIMKTQYDRQQLGRSAAHYTTRAERREFVVNELKQFAEATQYELRATLSEMERQDMTTAPKVIWMANALYFSATKQAINDLAIRRDIEIIGFNEKRYMLFDEEPRPANLTRGITSNVTQVNADQVWDMGYTGQGVVVAVIDTGVNYNHLDLSDHLWDGGDEYPFHGYDFVNEDNDPMDDHGHGTHCAGILCGDGTAGAQTGIAPDATLMCIKVLDANGYGSSTDVCNAMQWAVENGCDLISMSLGEENTDWAVWTLYRNTCEAVLDAGVMATCAAGNRGDGNYIFVGDWNWRNLIPDNVNAPGSCPPPYLDSIQAVNPGGLSCSICVGAVNINDAAYGLSSRGPVTWSYTEFGDYPYSSGSSGFGLIRPDVCAPGVDIISADCWYPSGYTTMTGTSMATPCVAGCISLLLSKNINVTPAEICKALEETAVSLEEGKSNTFGYGRVDVLAAFDALYPSQSIMIGDDESLIIGNGTHPYDYLPSYSYYKYSLSEQIYTAEELGDAGSITSIAFYNEGAEATRWYDIYLKYTTKINFSSTTDWEPAFYSDRVFSGSVTLQADDWTVITFDTPFDYDGISNLILVVNDNTGIWTPTSQMIKCRVSNTDENQALYSYSDSPGIDPSYPNNNPNGFSTQMKNQIIITKTQTNLSLPSFSGSYFSLSEQIYTANELGDAGLITSIAFYNEGAETTRSFDIYLKPTSKNSFSNSSDWDIVSDSDLVFSGNVTMQAHNWNSIIFDTPFAYDGNTALVLVVNNLSDWYDSSPYANYRVFNTDESQSIKIECLTRTDLLLYPNGFDPTNPPMYGTRLSVKNQLYVTKELLFNVTTSVNPLESGTVSSNYFNDFENRQIPSKWSNDNIYPWVVTACSNGSFCMRSGNMDVSNSISAIEVTADFVEDGLISFDYNCQGEGTSTYWDHCDFVLDDVTVFTHGAEFTGWNTFSQAITAGTHTFKWSYTKDGSVNPPGDAFFVDNVNLIGVDEGNLYRPGQSCSLSATANPGYSFVNWTENGTVVSTSANYSFVVTGARTLVANFEAVVDDYTIYAVANPLEGGTVSGAGTYPQGQTCTLTATANEGYAFANWTEDGEIVYTNPDYSFTVESDRNLVANFINIEPPTTNHYIPQGAAYSETMALYGVIQIDGVEQYSNMLEVGAFSGDECRGSAIASEFGITHRYLAILNIFGENGHQLTFKLYDHGIGEELELTSPATITFDVDGYGNPIEPYVLNFTSTVAITATLDPEEAGTVTGTGDYAIGATCTLTATANEGFQFKNWTLNGEVVSTEASYSFTVSEEAAYVAHFYYVHTQALASGWNWWSTYIEQQGIDGLEMLENSIGSAGVRIQGRDGTIDQFEYQGTNYWYGSLNAIANEQMYKIRTNAECNAVVVGDLASPSNHPIAINSGWNWIGFPCRQSQSLDEVMSGFAPEANDVIKGRNGSSTFISYGSYNLWYGTLTVLEPGQGYMYKSNSDEAKTLTFQAERGNAVGNAIKEDGFFTPNTADFSSNMLVTAVVETDGQELRSEEYELAAFVGDECRGSVRLMYVEPLDRYVAFLLVYGDAPEEVRFVLTDGSDMVCSGDVLTYVADGIEGTPTEPVTLHFGTLGLNESEKDVVNIFPNPSDGIFSIEGMGVRKIEVVDAYGQIILSKETKNDFEQIDLSDNADGLYLLRVVTSNGITTKQLIKK